LFDAAYDDKIETSMVVTASIDPTTTAVTATATRDISTILSSVIGIKTIQVGVRSQMLAESKSVPSCLIALKTSGTGISVTGQGSITAPNCGVYINSPASNALFGQSNGTLSAQATSIVGNYQLNIVPTPRPYINQKPIDDPLISLTQPAANNRPSTKLCDYNSNTFKGTMPINPKSGSNEVIYCGGIKFQGNITLGRGLHIFYGNVSISSSASLVGDGVTIFLGEGTGWGSTGSGVLKLTPPTSGTLKGIVFFGARNASKLAVVNLTANRDYFIEGTMYLPQHDVALQGDADANVKVNSGYFIANSFSFSGTSSLTLSDSSGLAPDILKKGLVNVDNSLRLTR